MKNKPALETSNNLWFDKASNKGRTPFPYRRPSFLAVKHRTVPLHPSSNPHARRKVVTAI